VKKLLKESSWLITAPLLLLTVIYLAFFFVPGRRELKRLRNNLDTTVKLTYQSESMATRIEAIRADLQATRGYTEAWRERSVPSPQLAEMYGRILALGRDAGTVFRSLDPDTLVPMEHLDQTPVNLVCAGSFSSIFDFVRRLEAFPEAVAIDSLEVTAPSKDGELTQCSLNLVIFTGHSQDSD